MYFLVHWPEPDLPQFKKPGMELQTKIENLTKWVSRQNNKAQFSPSFKHTHTHTRVLMR